MRVAELGAGDGRLARALRRALAGEIARGEIELLFWLWDIDDNGTLSYDEMVKGMVKLGYDPTIEMSHDDWDLFTQVTPQP